MATDGNSYLSATEHTDDVTTARQIESQLFNAETRPSSESGNPKRKNPFGSLLSLAWKLCEAEQKRRKLANTGNLSASGCLTSMLRTHQNTVALYDRLPYAAPRMPSKTNYMNFQPRSLLPTSVADKTCDDFENSLPRGIKQYPGNYNSYATYLPAIRRPLITSGVSKDAMSATHMHSQNFFSRWGDGSSFDNEFAVSDSARDDESGLSERRRHQCQMCAYQTDNKSHMLRHQATAHDACKLYHCYICKVDFSRSERAKAHFLSIHPEIPYHSKIIRKRPYEEIAQGAAAADPRLSDKEPGISKLGNSGGQTPARKSWEKYCRLVPPSGTSSCYFHCVRCPHVGPDIWHLKRHFLSAHSDSQAYSCRVCRYSTGDVQRLIGHMTGHGELFCHQCSFSTVELERFKEHLQTCTGEGSADSEHAQCPVCGDLFQDNLQVKQHVSENHQRDYCEHCACVIYGPETIEDHLLQHQTEKTPSNNNVADSSDCAIPTAVENAEEGQDNATNVETPEATKVSNEAEEMGEEGVRQSKYRFGRFSNQTYYCPVEGCPFKATWKKSIELHTLNYHSEMGAEDNTDSVAVVQSSSPDPASATAPVAISGLFNCPFCPNCRTFKYRKSYEKHLLQHGVDYVKHPYLVVRSSQREEATVQFCAM